MQIHRHISLILPLALLILLSACSNGIEDAAEIALPTQAWDVVLFQDDFSNPKSGWDRTNQGGNSTDYADGKYRITLATPQQDIWANPYQYFDKDIIVEVDAWQNPRTVQAAYGIICGYSDVNNFYALTIGGVGYVEIFRYQQGKRLTLASAENQARIDPEYNHLKAECASSALQLWVNGSLVAEVEALEVPYGDVGLIGSSFDEVPVEILFDNFVVWNQ
ncbi:MAG TPA: hypothetical protein DDW97_02275 [Anaerolineaceae bacterium]|nr:hypothetical protein [Anaerolineaceae bacterium]